MRFLPDGWSGEGFDEDSDGEDLSRVTDERLETSIVRLKRRLDAGQAALALQAAELERRGSTRTRHVLTTKQWLAHHCRMTKSAASTLLRTGATLFEHETLRSHSLKGEVTADGIRMLTSAAFNYPEDFRTYGAPIVQGATYLHPKELRQAVSYWSQQVDYPGAIGDIEVKRRRRRLSINQTWDGMWAVSGELDPESG